MQKTIAEFIFNHENVNWEINHRDRARFYTLVQVHIADTLRVKGYIYLNQIYDMLGAEWNPDNENICIKRGDSIILEPKNTSVYETDLIQIIHVC